MSDLLTFLGISGWADGWLDAGIFTLSVSAIIVAMAKATDSLPTWFFKPWKVSWSEVWQYIKKGSSPNNSDGLTEELISYPFWGFIQQAFMFWGVIPLLYGFLPASNVPITAALLFALLHFPNWHLFFPVAFMMMCFQWHWDLFHNIFALGVMHGIFGTLWQRLSPPVVSTSFSIWFGYIKNQANTMTRWLKNG